MIRKVKILTLFFVISLLLPFTYLIKSVLPFHAFISLLGKRQLTIEEHDLHKINQARLIKRAIFWVNKFYPGELNCLTQAATTKFISRLFGVNTTVYIGIKSKEQDSYDAHAWHACNQIIISGGGEVLKYKIMETIS